MIVFLLSGLWHGADWSFVAWGAYHGLLLVLLILLNRNTKYEHVVAHDRVFPSFKELGQMVLIFTLVTIGWMMFRASTITDFYHYILKIFSQSSFTPIWLGNKVDYIPLFVCIGCMLIIEWVQRNKHHGLEMDKARINKVLSLLMYAFALFVIFALRVAMVRFIYFQF